MTDYINRQMAIKEAHRIVIDGDAYDVVQVETLLGLPAADVVEVVRCKDCENNDHGRCGNWDYFKVPDMGFCDGGVRRC